jgi:hypothetical protein
MGLFATIFGGAAQKKAAKNNLAESKTVRDQSLADNAPYVTAGTNGLKAYLDSIGMGDSAAAMAAFQNSPEYQLNYNTALDQGRQGVTDVAQATGTYNSGRTLKALQDRAQQTSRGFFSDYMKGLGGVSDMGYNAAGRNVGIRQDSLQNITGARTGLANAKTSQYQGFDSLISGAAKLAGGGFNPFAMAPTSIY